MRTYQNLAANSALCPTRSTPRMLATAPASTRHGLGSWPVRSALGQPRSDLSGHLHAHPTSHSQGPPPTLPGLYSVPGSTNLWTTMSRPPGAPAGAGGLEPGPPCECEKANPTCACV